MGILVFDLNQGFERIVSIFYKYLKGVYQDVIQKTLSSNLEAFLIESTPFGFNPTKLTKSCPNGNEERRTKISFIFPQKAKQDLP